MTSVSEQFGLDAYDNESGRTDCLALYLRLLQINLLPGSVFFLKAETVRGDAWMSGAIADLVDPEPSGSFGSAKAQASASKSGFRGHASSGKASCVQLTAGFGSREIYGTTKGP